MLELIYGFYNEEEEERDIYEDIDEARADALHLSQNFNYDFIVLRDVDTYETFYEEFK